MILPEFCSVITGPIYDRRRCLKVDQGHRGHHWDITEPTPDGCECKLVCTCERTT